MVGSRSDTKSRAAWELARKATRVWSRRRASARPGLWPPARSSTALRTGRLHRVARGVYAVGWPQLTPKRRWMAAVLACGDGAVLSHRSAAALWGSRQGAQRSCRRQRAPAGRTTGGPGSRGKTPAWTARARHHGAGRDPCNHSGSNPPGPRHRARSTCARAGRQRSGQARPDRPRRAADGAGRLCRPAWRARPARAARPGDLPPVRLRSGGPFPAHRRCRGTAVNR